MNDPLLQAIVDERVASHGAHTVVLYGSRADGSSSASSDYDIPAFAAIGRTTRIRRPVGDTFPDVFVHPEGQPDAGGRRRLRAN